jgi:hypothetical protein
LPDNFIAGGAGAGWTDLPTVIEEAVMPALPTRIIGVLVSVALAGLVTAAPAGAVPGQPERVCESFNTGDDLRQLSVCSYVWIRDAPGQYRGQVDMHTYRLSNGQRVGDSVSQSITLNGAVLEHNSASQPFVTYGPNYKTNSCRLNSPSGPVSNCSVPNTASVTFYGTALNAVVQGVCNNVTAVSWRDDRGQPHELQVGSVSHPYTLPVLYQYGPCNP